ncbi:MAG: hydrolase [Chlamydiales bacterium]|jgi:ADP-ribose pyrophosphatase YjhB (NUDIX family)|nr:hydrolase [Chlamydiales bacterium]
MSKNRFKLPVAVHLLLVKNNQILLLRRYQTGYMDGHYGLVAGCIDGNEPVTQAMIREAKEEAGIELKPEWLEVATVMHRYVKDGNWESIAYFFKATHWEGEIRNNEPHKCDELKFFPIDDLPSTMIPYVYKGILSALSGQHFVEYGW